MSIHLMSLVWEINFPSPTQKLLALKIADYADDDGRGVYPSIMELARQVGASERQIQYAVRSFEGCDLLVRESTGGGRNRTNIWTLNPEIVIDLALQNLQLKGKHDALELVENEGANIAPRTLERVQRRAERVQSATRKGEAHCTQTLKNHQIEPLRASARENLDLKGVARSDLITLTPTDPEFADWLRYMRAKGQFDSVDAAIAASGLQVRHRLPPDKRKADEAKAVADRMIGEPTE
jgi:hypothetical protein